MCKNNQNQLNVSSYSHYHNISSSTYLLDMKTDYTVTQIKGLKEENIRWWWWQQRRRWCFYEKYAKNYKVCKSYYNPWSESVCSLLGLADMLLVYIVAVPLVLHCIVKDKMMILMMTSLKKIYIYILLGMIMLNLNGHRAFLREKMKMVW